MDLKLYIFILFAVLFVFVWLVRSNILDITKHNIEAGVIMGKRFESLCYVTVKTEPDEEGECSRWVFTRLIDFPLPPAIGQEIDNGNTYGIVETVMFSPAPERKIRVWFQDQVKTKDDAPDYIELLYADGWEFNSNELNLLFSDPLPLRGESHHI